MLNTEIIEQGERTISVMCYGGKLGINYTDERLKQNAEKPPPDSSGI